MVTVESILGGSGIWIWYLFLSTPTLIPSSISVGATESARSTTNLANCLTLMMYLGSSESALMILVQRATWSGCSFCRVCLSAAKSHRAGGASPVSDSFMPVSSLTRFIIVWMSSSTPLIDFVYCPWPWIEKNIFYNREFTQFFTIHFLDLRKFLIIECLLRQELDNFKKVTN